MKRKSRLKLLIEDILDNWQLWIVIISVLSALAMSAILTKNSFDRPISTNKELGSQLIGVSHISHNS